MASSFLIASSSSTPFSNADENGGSHLRNHRTLSGAGVTIDTIDDAVAVFQKVYKEHFDIDVSSSEMEEVFQLDMEGSGMTTEQYLVQLSSSTEDIIANAEALARNYEDEVTTVTDTTNTQSCKRPGDICVYYYYVCCNQCMPLMAVGICI